MSGRQGPGPIRGKGRRQSGIADRVGSPARPLTPFPKHRASGARDANESCVSGEGAEAPLTPAAEVAA